MGETREARDDLEVGRPDWRGTGGDGEEGRQGGDELGRSAHGVGRVAGGRSEESGAGPGEVQARRFHEVAEAVLIDVGVDLGGLDGGVAEEDLDGADVARDAERAGGERPAEDVGG